MDPPSSSVPHLKVAQQPSHDTLVDRGSPAPEKLRTMTFSSSATTPTARLSLENLREETMGSPDHLQKERAPYDFQSRHLADKSFHDSDSDENSPGADPEKDVEKQAEPTGAGQSSGTVVAEKAQNMVEWDGPDDPENPQNWPTSYKWLITLVMATMTMVITFSSSVFSTATVITAIEFGVSNEVTLLGTSLFVLGFCVGPCMWGPFSELFGRKIPLFTGFALLGIFQIPVAVAQNLETIFICRFLQGTFGCAPLAIVGGALADFWGPVDRGVATAVFAGATFVGPVAGPIVGGFITQSHLGWRWTAWITLIMVAFFGIIGLIIIPETFAPVLHQRKAARLRHETKNWALHAKLDETRLSPRDIAIKYILRPFQMLILEPILLLITIYLALVYGILYLFFEAYPISFQEIRGWNLGVGALPFLGITIGVVLGGAIISWITKTRFARKLEKHGRVIPEERLPPMIIGAIVLPIGLFWSAWTSNPNIHWAPQVVAGIPIGMGILMIFMQGLNYIIDVYLMFANSAIAGNTFLRSLAGAGFPMFANQMYHNLGVAWATSLLGFLTIAMIPVPILFYIYGEKLRKLSRFSPTL